MSEHDINQVCTLVALANCKILAVKLHRHFTGSSLKEAVNAVNSLLDRHEQRSRAA